MDGMTSLRPRKERAMEKLNDWWSGALGVDIENQRHSKLSASAEDPVLLEGKEKLAADLVHTPGYSLPPLVLLSYFLFSFSAFAVACKYRVHWHYSISVNSI